MKSKTRFLNSLYKRSVDIFNNKINYTYWIKNFKKIFSYDVNSDNVNIKHYDDDNNLLLDLYSPGKNKNIKYTDLYAGIPNLDFCEDTGNNVLIKTVNTEDQAYTSVFTYDEEGSMYVAGFILNQGTNNAVVIDNEVVIENNDLGRSMILVKYDKDGNFKWVKNFYMSSNIAEADINNRINSITCDKNGSIYLTGYFNGIIGDNNYTLSTINENRQSYFLRVNYDGDILNAKQTTTPINESAPGGTSIVCNYNYIYLAFLSPASLVTYDGQEMIQENPGSLTGFILKLTPSGNLIKYKILNTTSRSLVGSPDSLTLKNGYLYVSGENGGTTNFGTTDNPENVTSVEFEPFTVKYDLDFNFQWIYKPVTGGRSRSNSVEVDDDDNVYISIYFLTSIEVDGNTYNKIGTGGVLVKLDSNGQYVWDYYLPEIINAYSSSINNGSIYFCGKINANGVNIDNGGGTTLMNNPDTGVYAFVIKINKDTGLFDDFHFTLPRTGSDIYTYNDEFNNMYIVHVYNTINGPINYDFTGNTQLIEGLGTTTNNYNGMLMKLCNKFLNQ